MSECKHKSYFVTEVDNRGDFNYRNAPCPICKIFKDVEEIVLNHVKLKYRCCKMKYCRECASVIATELVDLKDKEGDKNEF